MMLSKASGVTTSICLLLLQHHETGTGPHLKTNTGQDTTPCILRRASSLTSFLGGACSPV